MNTLLEFIVQTKHDSYIVAVLFLAAFVPFWKLLAGKEEGSPR